MTRLYQLASGIIVLSIAEVLYNEYHNPEPIRKPQPPPFNHLAPHGARATLHDGVGWHGDEWIGVPLDAAFWEVPSLY
jgi:hypothetical protein